MFNLSSVLFIYNRHNSKQNKAAGTNVKVNLGFWREDIIGKLFFCFLLLQEAGSKQQVGLSTRPWPINGGILQSSDPPKQRDLLLTGHEDGEYDVGNIPCT